MNLIHCDKQYTCILYFVHNYVSEITQNRIFWQLLHLNVPSEVQFYLEQWQLETCVNSLLIYALFICVSHEQLQCPNVATYLDSKLAHAWRPETRWIRVGNVHIMARFPAGHVKIFTAVDWIYIHTENIKVLQFRVDICLTKEPTGKEN